MRQLRYGKAAVQRRPPHADKCRMMHSCIAAFWYRRVRPCSCVSGPCGVHDVEVRALMHTRVPAGLVAIASQPGSICKLVNLLKRLATARP